MLAFTDHVEYQRKNSNCTEVSFENLLKACCHPIKKFIVYSQDIGPHNQALWITPSF